MGDLNVIWRTVLKKDVKDVGLEGVVWIDLAQDSH